MPVLVTGCEDRLGAAVAERLRATGGEVRVWLDAARGDAAQLDAAQLDAARGDAARWRARGCKVALGAADDEGHLEAALEQVHTLVYTSGGPLEDPAGATAAFATAVGAALGAGCRRLVWVTELALAHVDGAAAPGGYLSALAERAELATAIPMDVVTLRTGLRYGPGDAFTAQLAAWASAPGVAGRANAHAPVWIDDVAAAVVAADAARGSPADVHLAVDLVGPDVVPLGRIAEQLAAVPGLAAPAAGPVPADVAAWLAVAATGDDAALGRDGVPFARGVAALHTAADGNGAGSRPG